MQSSADGRRCVVAGSRNPGCRARNGSGAGSNVCKCNPRRPTKRCAPPSSADGRRGQTSPSAWTASSRGRESRESRCQISAARPGDLYLAYACAKGDPGAHRHFDRKFIATLEPYVTRYGFSAHAMTEVKQRVRMKLLLGASPSIARYKGTGPLGAWVRVTAVRVAVDVAAVEGAPGPNESEYLVELYGELDGNPELETAKKLTRERFRAALEVSLQRLPAREKALLRLHFIEALSLEAVGLIYRVHRATVARWLVAVRAQVSADLRKELGMKPRGSTTELRSLVGMLRTEIQLSARRILGDG